MRQVSTLVLLATVVAMFAGCSDEDVPRSQITLVDLNGGDPLQADVINNGDDQLPGGGDDFIPEDEIAVTFRNAPSDAQGTMGTTGAFSHVTFEAYRITFASSVAIDPVLGGMHAVVPSGTDVTTFVVAVPGELKGRAPLNGLVGGGEILSTAQIEFWGVEETSNDEIYVTGNIVVNFANFGDE